MANILLGVYRMFRSREKKLPTKIVKLRISSQDETRLRVLTLMSGDTYTDLVSDGLALMFREYTGESLVQHCPECGDHTFLDLGGDFEKRELNYYHVCDRGHRTLATDLIRVVRQQWINRSSK